MPKLFKIKYPVKAALIMLCMLVGLNAQSQMDAPRYISYSPYNYNDTVFAFNEKTTIYSKPDTNSKTVLVANAGDTLFINDSFTFNGDKPLPQFLKVKSRGLQGYIKPSDIAIYKFNIINETSNSTIVIGVEYMSKDAKFMAKEYFENTFINSFSYPYYYGSFSLVMHGNRGLEGISKIFEILHFAEACGEDGGSTFIGWTPGEFYEILHASATSDGGIYSHQTTITFPEDSGGIAGKVIFQKEIYEVTNEELEWDYHSIETRIYNWTGSNLDPPFKENLEEAIDSETEK
ncbi:MAG: hypothetical protein IPO27_09040 [Bacteroidetes bacterium]|nr:hypothetical protein [Bacteroidota bacterium]